LSANRQAEEGRGKEDQDRVFHRNYSNASYTSGTEPPGLTGVHR
jgi:hypothetical protein